MKIFFDTEFTGLTQDAELISIGARSETGQSFYAEISDYDKSKINDFVKNNVISKLLFNNRDKKHIYQNNVLFVKDTKHEVSIDLNLWLRAFDEKIEFVSDVSHYDFVLLVDLLCGCALDLPEYICPACIDINQIISERKNISLQDAFDYSREKLVSLYYPDDIIYEASKHNSLYDAIIIEKIYNALIRRK